MSDELYTVEIDEELEVLIPRFKVNVSNDLVTMREELEAGNMTEVKRLGHSLKGAGLGYGFNVLGELGKKIELLAAQSSSQSSPSPEILALIKQAEDYLSNVSIKYVQI